MQPDRLFLGFGLAKDLSDKIINADLSLYHLFFHSEDAYLKEMIFNNQPYLGKFISCPLDVSSLESIKSHIISIIQRLLPDIKKFNPEFYLITHFENNE